MHTNVFAFHMLVSKITCFFETQIERIICLLSGVGIIFYGIHLRGGVLFSRSENVTLFPPQTEWRMVVELQYICK